jgi:hypothetical protein
MTSLRPALALVLATLASGALARPRRPGVPDAARPHYSFTEGGFKHFVADELPPLVEGEAFTWDGKRYEVVELHSVTRHDVSRWNPAHRNDAVPLRARVVAVVHVKIDGELRRARIEGLADYVTLPEGWRWHQVLLYLGANQSYDFVSGETN